MKLQINHNGKDYTLSYTRATARQMANMAEGLGDNEDIVASAEVMIKSALKAEHPDLTPDEATEFAQFVMENCQLIDSGEGENTEKGLLTYLNEMVMECMPKGFTGQTATKGFVVVK